MDIQVATNYYVNEDGQLVISSTIYINGEVKNEKDNTVSRAISKQIANSILERQAKT